jgi:hypothetical protein
VKDLWTLCNSCLKIDDDTEVKRTKCGAALSAKIERSRNRQARCVPLKKITAAESTSTNEVTMQVQCDQEQPSAAVGAPVEDTQSHNKCI